MFEALPIAGRRLAPWMLLAALSGAAFAQAPAPQAPRPAGDMAAPPQGPRPAQRPAARPAANKDPIKVGAISSMALFPDASAAARAYFEVVNASGGIRGRRIEFITEDDEANPEKAAAAARRLAEDQQVVAHVGSASLLECAVNAPYYVSQGLVSIQGTGVDPVCFDSPNISPTNTGPYLSMALGLQYLTEQRGRSRVCAYFTAHSVELLKPAFEREIAAWSARTQRRLLTSNLAVPLDKDPALAIQDAVRAGCDGAVYVGTTPDVIAWAKAVDRVKAKSVDWVYLTPAYTADMPQQLGPAGEGLLALSEFEPWTSRSPLLFDWRDTMKRGNVPQTSFSQGGYAAALVFVRVLRGIKGEITRESVTRAFKAMEPIRLPMMGTPYTFGAGKRHASNRAVVPVQLQKGRWNVAHWEFIVAPRAD